MAHVIEYAPSGRAKCRGCKKTIEKGAVRLGVAVPNAFGEGESLQYFHLTCGAERRSVACDEALRALPEEGSAISAEEKRALLELTALGIEHPRWTRLSGAEVASSGRAKCRHCKETIEKDSLRLVLEFVEEGMTNAAGFVHPRCATAYFGSTLGFRERLGRTTALAPEVLDRLVEGFTENGVESS